MAKNLSLELNINSATDLANVNHITKMDVYAVVTIQGDKTQKKQKEKTAVNRSGGSNPTWNHAVTFSVNERLAYEGRLTLILNLFSHRLLCDKKIGEVEVSLLDLMRLQSPLTNGNGHGMTLVTYQVRTPSETMKGSLTFSFRFNGLSVVSGQAYHQTPTWAPSSQQGYGPHGYIRPPPPPPGYGYGGPPPQQPSRNEGTTLQNADTFVSAMSLIS